MDEVNGWRGLEIDRTEGGRSVACWSHTIRVMEEEGAEGVKYSNVVIATLYLFIKVISRLNS